MICMRLAVLDHCPRNECQVVMAKREIDCVTARRIQSIYYKSKHVNLHFVESLDAGEWIGKPIQKLSLSTWCRWMTFQHNAALEQCWASFLACVAFPEAEKSDAYDFKGTVWAFYMHAASVKAENRTSQVRKKTYILNEPLIKGTITCRSVDHMRTWQRPSSHRVRILQEGSWRDTSRHKS